MRAPPPDWNSGPGHAKGSGNKAGSDVRQSLYQSPARSRRKLRPAFRPCRLVRRAHDRRRHRLPDPCGLPVPLRQHWQPHDEQAARPPARPRRQGELGAAPDHLTPAPEGDCPLPDKPLVRRPEGLMKTLLLATALVAIPLTAIAQDQTPPPASGATMTPERMVDARQSKMGRGGGTLARLKQANDAGTDLTTLSTQTQWLGRWADELPALFPAGTDVAGTDARAE